MSPDPSTDGQDDGDDARSRRPDAWADAARARADRLHQRAPAKPEPRERKAWFRQLPAKLAAMVVFLVALTTLLGNLLELREKGGPITPAEPSPARAAPSADAAPRAAVPSGPVRVRVALDRIAIRRDGSPGTTDWRFMVEADGEPLFAFEQQDLDDTGGRNVVRPRDVDATLRLLPGREARLMVKGWRLSRFRLLQGEPDVVGEGVIDAGGGEAAIRVASREAKGGAFVFHFSADAQ